MDYLTDEQIGKLIKKHRVYENLTQGELGELVGVQAAAVQKWESGKVKNIKRSVLRDLAKVLKINPSLLIGIPTEDFYLSDLTDNEVKEIRTYIYDVIKKRG